MSKCKKGDIVVWLDHGYDGIYEIEVIFQKRFFVYDIVNGERKGYSIFKNLKRKYRHATPEEIKAGRRLP